MSILMTLYSNVGHAYSVSVFGIQDSVLSKFPSFCAYSRFPGYGRSLGRDMKRFLSGFPLSPSSKEKAEQWWQ